MPDAQDPEESLCLWHRAVQRQATRTLHWRDQWFSAGELASLSRRTATALRSTGLTPGDAVMVCGADQFSALLLTLAALLSGVSVLPLPPLKDAGRLRPLVRRIAPRVLFATCLPPGGRRHDLGCRVALIDDLLEASLNESTPESMRAPYSGIVLTPPALVPGVGDHDAVASAMASAFVTEYRLDGRGAHLAFAPLWHPLPLTTALGALHADHALVLAADVEESDAVDCMKRFQAASAFMLPPTLRRVLSTVEGSCAVSSLSSLVCGVAPCSPKLREEAQRAFGPVLFEAHRSHGARRVVIPDDLPEGRRAGVWELAARRPIETAVIEDEGASIGRGDLVARARGLATGWATAGVPQGGVIASALPNGIDAVAAYLGAIEAGYAYLALHEKTQPEHLARVLEEAAASLLLSYRHGRNMGKVPVVPPAPAPTTAGYLPSEVAGTTILLTSGTTGRPRAIRRSHGDVDLGLRAIHDTWVARRFGFPKQGTHLVCGSLSTGAVLAVAVAAMHAGQSLLIMREWNPRRALELIERHRVSTLFALPGMLEALLRASSANRHDVSTLVSVVHGAAPCRPELKRELIRWLGPVVHEFFGSAEANGTSILASEWLQKPGSVGRPLPGVSLRIADDSGNAVDTGQVGNVLLGGTAVSGGERSDGYAAVGDIGYVDEDGYLYLVGRDAEVFNVAGTRFHAREVEGVLGRHEFVIEAVAVARPHPTLSECVVAFVEVAPHATEVAAAEVERSIRRFAKQFLPPAKRPRRLVLLATIPRTYTGKPDRLALRERLAAR